MKNFNRITSVLLLTLSLSVQSQLPENPKEWVCPESSYTEKQLEKMSAEWCKNNLSKQNYGWQKTSGLPSEPGQITDLNAKNNYDQQLRKFLNKKTYQAWSHDRQWRLTGPYVGKIGSGKSYGVHPGVRIYYSPEVVKWMCTDRSQAIPQGALIIKEMHDINKDLKVKIDNNNCMSIPDSDALQPTSWTVMARSNQSHDGWYWANPTPSGGNPPIVDKSGFMQNSDVPNDPVTRNNDWYPTGYLFGQKLPNGHTKVFDTVYPYSLFGAACINCHASAANEMTYASLDNIVSPGLQYLNFKEANKNSKVKTKILGQEDGLHSQALGEKSVAMKSKATPPYDSPFTSPLASQNKSFVNYFGDLGVNNFTQAWGLRFPAETFDHHISSKTGPDQFLTSDQCINCHDATYANSADANMVIDKTGSDKRINVSPYGEWRASPMGLAGRDPIFFSQLQSETNNLPDMKECIENTCLHCHGVMGERQQSIDHPQTENNCSDIFAIKPPKGVPFGKPFAKDTVTKWQNAVPNNHDAKYGALARDGISCMVCHQMTDTDFGNQASYTGNFVTNKPGMVVGPYADDKIITSPMENALGIKPGFGAQINNSDMCGTCHNILLPTYKNDGSLHETKAPNGQLVTATYEQTTHLEWVNSVFAKPAEFTSCIDCHMPTKYQVGKTNNPLKNMKIANIESNDFAPTTHRLPDADITLTERKEDSYGRHSLHGLNLFLNEMFQQFPMLLGIRQLDYMTKSDVQPSLITGNESMREMATKETADVNIVSLKIKDNQLNASVKVTNKTGHFLPSGVGFRRVFLEFVVKDKQGNEMWASGKTNELGVILKGLSNNPLNSEKGGKGTTAYQPHYQVITAQDQVQIYQELIKDSNGYLTTSFLRRVEDVKDNRLRGRGYDPKMFLNNPSPYIQILGELIGNVTSDKYYYDPKFTGSDVIDYQINFDANAIQNIGSVSVKLYNQSIPPAYLQDRFSDANVGPSEKTDIQRLFYISSHLNTESDELGQTNAIKNWKTYLTGDCKTIKGIKCP